MAQNKSVNVKNLSAFDKFCEVCFNALDADRRVALKNNFLKEPITKILNDTELAESLKSFFENNLNISETSRNTFVHRNTLVYRLDKIQKVTGLDARKFEDAISIRLYMWLKNRDN